MKYHLLLLFCCVVLACCSSPEQIHISFGDTNADGYTTGIIVTWYTQDQSTNPTLTWGLNNATLTNTAPASTSSYLKKYGFHHTAQMRNLQPSTTYYYRVGDSSSQEWGPIISFTSPPQDHTSKFSVSIFGDMGWLGSQERPMQIAVDGLKKNWSAVGTRQQIEELKNKGEIDFVWHLGDIAYADDAFAHNLIGFSYEKCYSGFMNWFQNVSSIMPYMVAPGNHESECHSPACVLDHDLGAGLANFSAYNARWNMPSAASGGVASMWYSFNRGPIHFVSINTETDFPGAPEEKKGDSGLFPAGGFGRNGEYLQWLEADLAKANSTRGLRPFIIAGGHRPWKEASKSVGDLFDKYGVDMYFAGHSHSYTRSVPSRNGVRAHSADDTQHIQTAVSPHTGKTVDHYVNANGTTYIVVGGAGCDEMQFLADPENPNLILRTERQLDPEVRENGYMVPEDCEVEDVFTAQMASGVLQVVNQTTLYWKLIESFGGKILDELYITRH